MKRHGVPLAWCLAAAVLPLSVAVVLIHAGAQAVALLSGPGVAVLLDAQWRPVAGRFGVLPLVTATLAMSLLSGALAVAIGIPAAIRLAFFAGPLEARLCEAGLALLAGLPSVVLGLAGLAWAVPAMGFSLLAGAATLLLSSLPTCVLLAAAALRQQGTSRGAACRALGLTDRQLAWGEAIRGAAPSLVLAAGLVTGKGFGEATAVSFVIGCVAGPVLPGPLDSVHTLATAILKDHSGAVGEHHGALFAAAWVLTALILVTNTAAAWWARRAAGGQGGASC
jgi:phosphate transport system permease protein